MSNSNSQFSLRFLYGGNRCAQLFEGSQGREQLSQDEEEALEAVPGREQQSQEEEEALEAVPGREQQSQEEEEAVEAVPGREQQSQEEEEALEAVPGREQPSQEEEEAVEAVPGSAFYPWNCSSASATYYCRRQFNTTSQNRGRLTWIHPPIPASQLLGLQPHATEVSSGNIKE